MLSELCASFCYCWESYSTPNNTSTIDTSTIDTTTDKESYQKVHQTIIESFQIHSSDSNHSLDDSSWSDDSLVIIEPGQVDKNESP